MSKILGTYVNGNTIVVMREDGTKERYIRDGENPAPEFPESIDLKVTNCCDMGCEFCAESSTPDGKHADLMDKTLLETIHPYTELAIGGGNPLEHPDLCWFLGCMKRRNVICNLTVNVNHFMRDDVQSKLHLLTDAKLIHGLGISITDTIPDGFFDKVKNYQNAVIHTIAGYTPISTFYDLCDRNLNLLILGYKDKGRGKEYLDGWYSLLVEVKLAVLKNNIRDFRSKFKAVAFDNLAVKQLNIQEELSKDEFDRLYMGYDGEYTMYIDLVTRKYGKSSTHPLRSIDSADVSKLFRSLQPCCENCGNHTDTDIDGLLYCIDHNYRKVGENDA